MNREEMIHEGCSGHGWLSSYIDVGWLRSYISEAFQCNSASLLCVPLSAPKEDVFVFLHGGCMRIRDNFELRDRNLVANARKCIRILRTYWNFTYLSAVPYAS